MLVAVSYPIGSGTRASATNRVSVSRCFGVTRTTIPRPMPRSTRRRHVDSLSTTMHFLPTTEWRAAGRRMRL